MIKVIGFDLDDTLWAVKPVIIKAEASLDDWLRSNVPELRYSVPEMRQFRDVVLERDPNLVKQITEFRRQIILLALEASHVVKSNEIADAAIEVFLHERNKVNFFDGALDALTTLAGSHTIGALSNGNADISRLGLNHLFSFGFSAEQVGAPKPSPALFNHALDHASIQPEQMIYVGDDPILDVDAANKLGINTIWLDHGTKPQGETAATYVIQDIKQLTEAVAAIDRP